MIKIIKNEKYFLIGLFVFAFLIRSLIFVCYLGKNNNYWQVDSNTYHKIAINIASGDGITIEGKPEFYRLPGYSMFLALYYKLFGENTKNVLWFQIFLASFISILIFFLSLVFFPTNLLLAKIAGIYSSIHLGLVLYSGFFMTETLFIFFFLLFSILFFSSFHVFFCHKYFLKSTKQVLSGFAAQPCPDYICSGPSFVELCNDIETWQEEEYKNFNLSKLFWAGIFLGFASLMRPVGHYLIVLSIFMLIFSRGFWFDKIKKISFIFLGWLFIVFGWLLRNWMLTGYLFFHTLPGGHFLYFSAARIVTHEQNCSYNQAKEFLREKVSDLTKQKEQKLGRTLNEPELSDLRMDLAIQYFKKCPFLTLKNWVTDILRTSFSLYSAELLYLDSGRQEFDYFGKDRTIFSMFTKYLFPQTKNIWLKILVFWEILTYIFILIGFFAAFIIALFRKNDLCVWIKIIPFMGLFIVISLSGGYSRMRLPIEPFLIILSFSFWVSIFKKINFSRLN